MKSVTKKTISADETEALGEALGRSFRGGEIVALVGELGAGKTTFIKGLARGLGVSETVTSPTFVLVKIYKGRKLLYHIDFYRLGDKVDYDSVGFEDYLDEEGVVAIEWAEKFIEFLPKPLLLVEIEASGEFEREIKMREVTEEGDKGRGSAGAYV